MKPPENRAPEEEARYRRLVISHFDFAEAAQFLNQFMALPPTLEGKGLDADELRRALTVASIIAYARPFTKNYGAPTTAASVRIEDVAGLTPSQKSLHTALVNQRAQAFAHSDAEIAALRYERGHPNGAVPRVRDPRIALTFAEAENCHALAAKLSIWSASEAARISGVYVIGANRAAPGTGGLTGT